MRSTMRTQQSRTCLTCWPQSLRRAPVKAWAAGMLGPFAGPPALTRMASRCATAVIAGWYRVRIHDAPYTFHDQSPATSFSGVQACLLKLSSRILIEFGLCFLIVSMTPPRTRLFSLAKAEVQYWRGLGNPIEQTARSSALPRASPRY